MILIWVISNRGMAELVPPLERFVERTSVRNLVSSSLGQPTQTLRGGKLCHAPWQGLPISQSTLEVTARTFSSKLVIGSAAGT